MPGQQHKAPLGFRVFDHCQRDALLSKSSRICSARSGCRDRYLNSWPGSVSQIRREVSSLLSKILRALDPGESGDRRTATSPLSPPRRLPRLLFTCRTRYIIDVKALAIRGYGVPTVK
jgi:hypothetical protein